jgi:hypothetical protein
MKRLFILLVLLSMGTGLRAQVLNVESLRKVTDTSGLSGYVGVNFSLIRNVNEFVVLGSDILLQYKMNDHLVLLKNDIRFLKIEGEDFANNGITHLRYNYRFHPRIRWEVFAQAQYNRVALIDFRGLLGTGPRFKLTDKEKYKFYLGTLVMYEYEELADGVTPINRDIRGSAYLSFSLYPSERVTIVSTTYYQPLFKQFSDFRISSDSTLAVELLKPLSLTVSYQFFYDPFPAVGIPTSQYNFTTGLTYSFD